MEDEINVLKTCWVMTTDRVLDEGNIALKLAIKNVLKELERLKQENKELNRLLKFSLDYRHKLEEDLYEGASNFIVRKDKIREKLKKLIKKLNEPNNDRWEKDDNIYYDKIKCQIRILKELLEGDKNG